MIHSENFQTTCADGVVLKGRLLIPEDPKAVLQFNGGTAALKEFYLPFLTYLAEHGYLCCLWDYRGSGESAPADMRHCEYTFRDYGIQDMPAVKSYLRQRFPHLPYLLFAHSVGGQQVGFMPELDDCQGMVGFAVSTGYAPHMPLGYRIKSNYFFYAFTPISILLTGYLKAKRFGIMEDLPRNVVREWRDWCSRKNYFFDPKFTGKTVPKGQFDRLPFPVHIFWSTDDPISNARSLPTFWSHVESIRGKDFTRIDAKQYGKKGLGHFGFFKKRVKDSLWPMALAKLDAFLEPEPAVNP